MYVCSFVFLQVDPHSTIGEVKSLFHKSCKPNVNFFKTCVLKCVFNSVCLYACLRVYMRVCTCVYVCISVYAHINDRTCMALVKRVCICMCVCPVPVHRVTILKSRSLIAEVTFFFPPTLIGGFVVPGACSWALTAGDVY